MAASKTSSPTHQRKIEEKNDAKKHPNNIRLLQRLNKLNAAILTRSDIELDELETAFKKSLQHDAVATDGDTFLGFHFEGHKQMCLYSIVFLIFLFFVTPLIAYSLEQILQVRCFVPNNYIIWEATR